MAMLGCCVYLMGLLTKLSNIMTPKMCFEYNHPSKQTMTSSLVCMDRYNLCMHGHDGGKCNQSISHGAKGQEPKAQFVIRNQELHGDTSVVVLRPKKKGVFPVTRPTLSKLPDSNIFFPFSENKNSKIEKRLCISSIGPAKE